MRGEFFHNRILVGRLEQEASECGATTSTEQPVQINGRAHYSDLVITHQGQTIVCEAENVPARVGNDVLKAVVIGAGTLIIATPDAPTAQACRRKLRRLKQPQSDLQVIICPLGAALEILRAILTKPVTPNINER